MITSTAARQESQEERYAESLAAIMDCIQKGVTLQTLQTLKYELAIDPRDYQAIMDYCLSKKFAGALK